MPRWLPWRSALRSTRAENSAAAEAGRGQAPSVKGIPEFLPTGPGGIFVFESDDAEHINRARMEHLASLGLKLDGQRVLDAGAGIGKLARFFVERGCQVVCVDGRAENISVLRERYPDMEGVVGDLQTDPLAPLAGPKGLFDVVFCYGILYHMESPLAGLRNLTSVCGGLMLIETMVCDFSRPVASLADESVATWNQAISPFAMRPSPAWVAMALSRMGFYCYTTHTTPDYPDYRFKWQDSGEHWRDGHPLRCVFVGSRTALDNPNLRLLSAPNQPTEGRRP